MGPRMYTETVQKIRRIAGSTLMQAPGSVSMLDTEAGALIERYLDPADGVWETILGEVCSQAAASSVPIRVTGGCEGAAFTGYRLAMEPGIEA